MIAPPPTTAPDLTTSLVKSLVLYSLAEFQSGHARTIRVSISAESFSVADDGRGHALDRVLSGVSYVRSVYTQLAYPFEAGHQYPVQLQTIGLSLINVLCSELSVNIRKRETTLRLSYRNGDPEIEELITTHSDETGNTISGTICLQLRSTHDGFSTLLSWLKRVKQSHPDLRLFFNGIETNGPSTEHESTRSF